MRKTLFLIVSILASTAILHAAINPAEFLKAATEVIEGKVTKVEVSKSADAEIRTIEVVLTVTKVEKSSTGIKAGEVVRIQYLEQRPKPDSHPANQLRPTGPQALHSPDAPQRGEKIKAYLKASKTENGGTKLEPSSHQYSFEVTGEAE